LENLQASIERVVINKLEENTFHAQLFIKAGSGLVKIMDARPSDSIALAVRAHAPIFVEDEIMKQASAFNQSQ